MSSRPNDASGKSRAAWRLACLALLPITCAGPAHAAPPAVTGAWARATIPGQDSGVVYLTITSPVDDTLTAAASPGAASAMLHQTTHGAGMSAMQDVERLSVPAGVPVRLAPNGTHIMLMGLRHRLVAGSRVQLDLVFAHAGTVHVSAVVEPLGASGPQG